MTCARVCRGITRCVRVCASKSLWLLYAPASRRRTRSSSGDGWSSGSKRDLKITMQIRRIIIPTVPRCLLLLSLSLCSFVRVFAKPLRTRCSHRYMVGVYTETRALRPIVAAGDFVSPDSELGWGGSCIEGWVSGEEFSFFWWAG